MNARIAVVAGMSLVAALAVMPARSYAQQAAAQDHSQHHPAPATAPPQDAKTSQTGMAGMMADMKAEDQKLDALVKKMNAAKGAEKTEAMAELLTVLVENHRAMHETTMSRMSSMGPMMGNMGGRGAAPKK